MNKKLFSLIAAAVVAAACAVGLAACGHTHEMTHHAAKQATCTEDGNVEYWYCGGCEKYFADEKGGEELESIVVEAAGHRWDEGRVTKEPDCTEDGERTFTCTVCKTTRTEAIEAAGHTFSEEWSGDSTYHWRAATCGHADMVADRGEHTWQDGVCSVCARVRTQGLDYALSADGTHYTVSGIGKCAESDIFIPSAYSGLPVRAIADRAFDSCAGLKSIIIPDGVTSIGDSAFRGCSGLENITIGNGVKSIGYAVFFGCTSLTGITIPDGVTSIGMRAFDGCTGLKSIIIPDSVTSIGDSAFHGCSSLESVTIGNGVKSIGGAAFSYCNSLENITIPDSVTSIGANAFANSSLTNIIIPDSVMSIGGYAFYNCSSLKSVTIGNGVTSIDYCMFCGCGSLESIIIPDGVNSIGESAFAYCSNLKSVTIGNEVDAIDYLAFSYCSALTDIVFRGTMAEWNGIKKGEDWDSGAGNYTVHCTDGDISKND